ncbi:hypothetical protein [Methylorubrum sp. SB2]|uniref:spike base protein, RCAP_Rcc01079 family n=1 Tax=Methylorubrum subtropicum TaxID=3138812 RepID=UPI00313AA44E
MSRISPVRDFVTVDISSTDFTSSNGFNCIYVGTTGNVTVLKADGSQATLPNMAGGMWHPVQGKGIVRSSTTATGLAVGFS